MNAFIERLLAQGPVLTDGAWGTQLQARGLAVGEFPDGWNLSQPDKVAEVAQAYVDAGSQVILTNTFGANRARLAEEPSLSEQIQALNQQGVAISKSAAGQRACVFASIGPSGKLLLTGESSPEELRAAYEEQAQALAEAGADALVVETMADLQEATLAVTAAKTTRLPVVACMVFDTGPHKDRTLMGVTPEQAATGLAEAGADVIGANCGQGIESFVAICRRLHAATALPIWIKANAGLPQLVDGRTVYQTSPETFASYVPDLVGAGANFIGGCCGTSPDFIRAVKQKLRKPSQPSW